MRNYGTNEAPLILSIRPSPIGEVMQLSVFHAGGKKDVAQISGSMTLDSAEPVPISMLTYPTKPAAEKRGMYAINLTMKEFEPVRTASSLRIRSSKALDWNFALTQMAAVAKTLDRCVLNLRKVWNLPLNAEEEKARNEMPRGNPLWPTTEQPLFTYFKSRDYPSVAIFREGSGSVKIVMLVDENGKLATCNVIEASGHASLDAQTCAIMKERAKFRPGVDAAGKPVKSGMVARINWALP